MTREKVEEIVNDFLVNEIEVDADKITPDANLKTDLGIDSLDFVDIVVIVEKNFGFKIKAEEMQGVQTLAQFYDYIQSKI
ncbi:MAG: phosphopantetheine-binding protein [Paludibacter sp.]|nr:phosphopantetheine-binding protein [Paludibacter sp.]